MAVPTAPAIRVDVAPEATQLPISDALLLQLAHECARDLYPLDDILKLHGLTPEYFHNFIKNHPAFMRFYAEAHQIWNSSANAKERSALKAGILFEQWLEKANALMASNEPLSSKVQLMQFLARVAGFDQGKDVKQSAPGDRVVVNINLGAGRTFTIDKTLKDVTPEGNVIEAQ